MVIGDEQAADAHVADGHPVTQDPRNGAAHRTAGLRGPQTHGNPQASRDAAAALWKAAGIKSPIDEIDVAEVYVPFSWYEPMWLESLGFAPEGEGWKLTEAGETAMTGRESVESVRRRAVVQPDRCVRHDPLRRIGDPGHGQGGRSPDRRGAKGPWPRLRRRRTVLLDVSGNIEQAVTRMQYTVSVAMSPIDQLNGLAKTA